MIRHGENLELDKLNSTQKGFKCATKRSANQHEVGRLRGILREQAGSLMYVDVDRLRRGSVRRQGVNATSLRAPTTTSVVPPGLPPAPRRPPPDPYTDQQPMSHSGLSATVEVSAMDGVTHRTGKGDLGIDGYPEALALVNELDCLTPFHMTMDGVWASQGCSGRP